MASYVTPKKNTQFIFYIGLIQQADTRLLKSNPTLATGDFKVSIDGGSLANLGTTPTVTPAAGAMVKITLSTSEMNGDNITVVCSDAAGAEWCDQIINIQTSARQIDDLAYPATSGRSMVVDAAGLVDANAVKVGPTGAGTAQTARDVGASVLLSAGTGTGQLDFTSGVVKSNLAQILGTALTETAGQIAAAFKKLFDVAAPVLTCVSVNQTGDSYARIGAPAGASVSADVAAVKVDTAAIGAKTTNLPASPAATSDIPTANANADALLDRSGGVETGITPRQGFRVMLAALAGKLSGAATTTVVIRDTNDAKNRISATVDANGNRSAVTLDLT